MLQGTNSHYRNRKAWIYNKLDKENSVTRLIVMQDMHCMLIIKGWWLFAFQYKTINVPQVSREHVVCLGTEKSSELN